MVTPLTTDVLLGALGLTEVRAALRFLQQPSEAGGFGLGLSRREIARRIGINESTLRGFEREGATPRQRTLERVLRGFRESDLFVQRSTNARTASETFTAPDVSPDFYVPRPPPGAQAFRLIVKMPEGSSYPFATLTPRSTASFNVRDEIQRQREAGFTVARVIWDTGA